MTPGRERSTRSRARAHCSSPFSIDKRRSSIFASTCPRKSFRHAPTVRFRSGAAGFSQLSVIRLKKPDFRPSHWSLHSFHKDSTKSSEAFASNWARTSTNKDATWSGRVTPRSASVRSGLLSEELIASVCVMRCRTSALHAAPLQEKIARGNCQVAATARAEKKLHCYAFFALAGDGVVSLVCA